MVVEKYLETRAHLSQALSALVTLSQQTGEPDATIQNLQSLSAGLNDPLLFVAVGEVKAGRSEEHTSELQSHLNLVCRLLLEKKKKARKEHVRPEHIKS